jgi:hypothetical protein
MRVLLRCLVPKAVSRRNAGSYFRKHLVPLNTTLSHNRLLDHRCAGECRLSESSNSGCTASAFPAQRRHTDAGGATGCRGIMLWFMP